MPATDDTQDPRRSWLNVIPQMHRDGPLSLLCKQRLSPKPVPFTPDDQCKINLIAGGAYEILRKKHRDPKGHFIFEGYGVSQIPEHHFLPALLKKFFPNNLPETFEALNDLQRCVFVLFGSEINHRQNVPAHIGGTIEERSVTNTELKSRASLLEASKEGTATLLDLEKHRNLSMMRELMYLLQAVKTRQAHPESHGYIVIGQHHTERIAQLAESCFGIKPFIFDPINPREGTCGISQKTFTHRYKTPSNDWLNNGCARLKASFLTQYPQYEGIPWHDPSGNLLDPPSEARPRAAHQPASALISNHALLACLTFMLLSWIGLRFSTKGTPQENKGKPVSEQLAFQGRSDINPKRA